MSDDLGDRTAYYTDGKGSWQKVVRASQCDEDGILYGRCQGVDGHRGCHWSYRPDGSYGYWLNEDDPSSIEEGVGGGSIPPDHMKYVHPVDKKDEYYLSFHVVEEVTDPEIIERLENDDPPDPGGTIDKPASEEDIEHLRKLGRIPANEK